MLTYQLKPEISFKYLLQIVLLPYPYQAELILKNENQKKIMNLV